jgi:hypothetical protein
MKCQGRDYIVEANQPALEVAERQVWNSFAGESDDGEERPGAGAPEQLQYSP